MEHSTLLRGCLSAIVLKLLNENGRMYGYQITQRVRELTAGEMVITEGALYPTLHKLEAEGVLTTETEKVDGRIRKYYRIAEKGTPQAAASIESLQAFVENIQRILNPKLALNG